MQHNDNSRTTRKRRLPQNYYDLAHALRWHDDLVTDAERVEIEAATKRLVRKAKFQPDPNIYQDPFVESMRLLTTWDEQGKPDTARVDKDKEKGGGEDWPYTGRVMKSDAGTICITNDHCSWIIQRAGIARLGRIDVLDVRKMDPLTEDERERVNALRKLLSAVDREDDQILRCIARYKYEKEIFDIEHPIDDRDDWSAWEEEEEEAAAA